MCRLLALTAVLALAVYASHAAVADNWWTHKLCKAKTIEGMIVTFNCKLSQKCCRNQPMGHKSCVPKSAICF